jgi:hypothetical protein
MSKKHNHDIGVEGIGFKKSNEKSSTIGSIAVNSFLIKCPNHQPEYPAQ